MPLAKEDRVQLASLQAVIREELEAFLTEYEELLSGDTAMLQEICDHLKQGRSKRFRPTLLLISAKDGPAVNPDAVFAAAIVELIHTATLVHDDFIDDAAVRRRLPTVNVKWGREAALIMGDFLYSKAFALMTERGLHEPMRILARTTHRMSVAEMLQLERHRRLDLGEDDYFHIIREKTASLIEAACEIGALMHSGVNGHREAFGAFGQNVGLAFQITDDVFDYLGDHRRLGKPVGADWREGRITLPFISARRNASATENKRLEEAMVDSGDNEEIWPTVCEFVENNGGVEYSYRVANELGRKAKEHISSVDVRPQRDILADAVDYVLGRIQ